MEYPQLLKIEYGLYWLAVLCYIAATILSAYALFFKKTENNSKGLALSCIGMLPHSAAIVLRWYVSGHGPYLNKLEAFSSTAWVIMATYLFIVMKHQRLRHLALFVLPPTFLLIAVGILRTPEIEYLPATFHTIWLILHIFFTKLALGAILLALGCSILYIIKDRKGGGKFLQRMPDLQELDSYAFKFSGFALLFWSITIVAGAIWAHKSWGRYWGWDPIETWSLVTWLCFGLNMHLRKFYRLQGRKAAYFMIACFAIMIATLFVMPFTTATVHTEYLM